MFCPFKFTNSQVDMTKDLLPTNLCQCEREQCQLWNERFGKCSLAVDAYLKAQDDLLKERG